MTTNNNNEQQTSPDKEITLHYIDKVHSSLTETVQSLNRVGVLLFLLSLIIIALCFGLVSADSNFSFDGLNFVVSFWVVLIGGAWVIGILFIYVLSLENHRDILKIEIIKLYKSIGYENKSMELEGTGALEVPNLTSIIGETVSFKRFFIGKIINGLLQILLLMAFLLTPIIAEISAFYKTIVLIGWVWWAIVSFLLLFLLTIFYLVAFLRSAF